MVIRAAHPLIVCLGVVLWFAAHTDARGEGAYAPAPQKATAASRVVVWEEPGLVTKYEVHGQAVARAFEKSLAGLEQTRTADDAWKKLVSPKDHVSIHIATPGNPILAPPRDLVRAIVQGLLRTGVAEENITIWGKQEDLMVASGYSPGSRSLGVAIESVLPGGGFDPEVFYFNEVVGKLIWGDFEFIGQKALDLQSLLGKEGPKDSKKDGPAELKPTDQISNRSHFAKIITRKSTRVINLSIMSDHPQIGLWGASASLALDSVDNERRFQTRGGEKGPGVGEILKHHALEPKVVLHIMCGVVAQFAGGPTFRPNYAEQAGLLYVSHDPVAIDSLALERIIAWRKAREVAPVGDAADYLKEAERLGAGHFERSKISVTRLP